MKRFDEYLQHFSDVDGWFQTPAIAIWDSLLSYQQEHRISGKSAKIGAGRETRNLPLPRCTAKAMTPVFSRAQTPLDEESTHHPGQARE